MAWGVRVMAVKERRMLRGSYVADIEGRWMRRHKAAEGTKGFWS